MIMNWDEGGEKEIMLLSVVYLLKGIEMIFLKPQNIILQSYFTPWGNFCLIMYNKYWFQIHQLQIHLIQPGQTKETSEPSTDQKPKGAAVSNIPRIVDNKRRHMEKTLSQAQGEQPLTNTAKEDLLMKSSLHSKRFCTV